MYDFVKWLNENWSTIVPILAFLVSVWYSWTQGKLRGYLEELFGVLVKEAQEELAGIPDEAFNEWGKKIFETLPAWTQLITSGAKIASILKGWRDSVVKPSCRAQAAVAEFCIDLAKL